MNSNLTRNLSLIALLWVVGATAASAQVYWFETYESAVDKIEGEQPEDMEQALELITALLADRPVPEAQVRVPGDRYVDYLPYFQQARIQWRLGQFDEARESLNKSEAFPAVRDNREAMTAMREMRSALDRVSAVTVSER